MFKKSARKIVVAIMSILVCLFIGTLAVIYGSSYFEVTANNYGMLERHAELYTLSDHIDPDRRNYLPPELFQPLPNSPPTDRGGMHFEDTPAFQLSTFYSVAVSDSGSVLAIDAAGEEIYEEATLEKYATDILKSGKERGVKESLVFLVTEKSGYKLITFMDNTVMQGSMTTLFRYTLMFGSIVLVILFFLARYIAKRIVRPLEESYQKQKQFISDAGHELKTPVSVVSANAELLSRQIGDNQWLANIQYENERMGKLVSQLLELSRTENVKPYTERIDFSRLVAGGALPFESVAFENGLTLRTEISDNISVDGNMSQLSQLVSILIDNAIRHSRNGKEVDVVLTETRNSAVLVVVNSGEPIPQDKIEKLFERFYRSDEVRNGADNHYGLGLAIAKAIVAAHNGKIEVRCYNGLVEFKTTIAKS